MSPTLGCNAFVIVGVAQLRIAVRCPLSFLYVKGGIKDAEDSMAFKKNRTAKDETSRELVISLKERLRGTAAQGEQGGAHQQYSSHLA